MVPDFDLWAKVSTSIEPASYDLAKELQKYKSTTAPEAPPKPGAPHKTSIVKQGSGRLRKTGSLELTGLDRSQQRKFLRGKARIDARIDLHGETIQSARHRLFNFLQMAYQNQMRTVLVITGKGDFEFSRHTLHGRDYHESSPRTGRLRKALPDWLHDPEFRVMVAGFQPAHPRHGGGGAVYIRLRNVSRQSGVK